MGERPVDEIGFCHFNTISPCCIDPLEQLIVNSGRILTSHPVLVILKVS